MRKWIILGVVLVVLAGAVGLALANLNSYLNQNKDWLSQQVASAIGRKVSFSEVGVSILGGFGARIKDLKIADDPAFSADTFVSAGDAQVKVAIWPALFGRYEVKRVRLMKPEVTIIRTQQGMNFDSISGGKGGAKPETSAEGGRPKKPEKRGEGEGGAEKAAQAAGGAAFLVSLIDLKDGQLRFLDKTTTPPSDFLMKDVDFAASEVSLDRPIRLKLATALFGAEKQNLSLTGTLGPLGSPPNVQKAEIDLDLKLGPVVIDNMRKLEALAKALPPELSSADPIVLEAKVKGSLDHLKISASFDGSSAAIRFGSSFDKPRGTALKLAVDARRDLGKIDVEKLALQLAELELSGKGVVDTVSGGALDFQLDSRKTPLAGWDKLIPAFAGHQVSGTIEVHVRAQGRTGGGDPPALTGTVALTNVSAKQQGSPYEIDGLTTELRLKGRSATLPPTQFKLSGSPVELDAQVDGFKPVVASFNLKSAELSAASLNFASPEAKNPERLRGVEIHGRFQQGEKNPDFQGTVRSAEGSLRDIDYQGLDVALKLHEQVATLDKLVLRAFQGSYDGSGRYDLRDPAAPRFDFRSRIREMDLKSLLASQSPGAEKRIDGRLDADLSLDGVGKGWDAIQKTLRGDGRLDVKDGVIRGVNIADEVLASVTGIGGLSNLVSPRTRGKYPALFSTADTRFEKLGGSLQIAEGVARSDDLELAARDYALRGRGTFQLTNQLDANATLVASRALSDDLIADVREAKYIANTEGKIEIPFRLTGALPNVKPKPDGEFIARALQRAIVGKGVEKLGEQLFGKDRSGQPQGGTPGGSTPKPEQELLKKGLEGLFGR